MKDSGPPGLPSCPARCFRGPHIDPALYVVVSSASTAVPFAVKVGAVEVAGIAGFGWKPTSHWTAGIVLSTSWPPCADWPGGDLVDGGPWSRVLWV